MRNIYLLPWIHECSHLSECCTLDVNRLLNGKLTRCGSYKEVQVERIQGVTVMASNEEHLT